VPQKSLGIQSIAFLPIEDYSGSIGVDDNADFVRKILAYQFYPFRTYGFWPMNEDFDPLMKISGLQLDMATIGNNPAVLGNDEVDATLRQNNLNTPSKINSTDPKKLGELLGCDGIVYCQLLEFKSQVVSEYFSGYDFRIGQDWAEVERASGTINVNYTFPLLDSLATPEGVGKVRNFSVAQKISEKLRVKIVNAKQGTVVFDGTLNLVGIRPYAVVIPEWNYQELDFKNEPIFKDKKFPSIYFYYYVLLAKSLRVLSPE
jgi:hypothetical protein